MCLLCRLVTAQPAPPTPPVSSVGVSLRFDIPVQALAAALEQYGAISGRPVFFDSSLVAGRTSTAVRGDYAPEAALRKLLEGTGLTVDDAEPGRTDAFVLHAADPEAATAPAPASSDLPEPPAVRRYDGLLQNRILQAFCDSPLTGPGDYRTALRFRVDAAGDITDARLLHSTGEHDRDLAVLTILQTVQLDEPPPPELAQPIYMVILPRGSVPGVECRSRP